MTQFIYQQLQGENNTALRAVAFFSVVFFTTFTFSSGADQYCQSDYSDWPVTNAVEEPKPNVDAQDLAGTAADLAPYSYGFYSQNFFMESIYARTPAAFSLIS